MTKGCCCREGISHCWSPHRCGDLHIKSLLVQQHYITFGDNTNWYNATLGISRNSIVPRLAWRYFCVFPSSDIMPSPTDAPPCLFSLHPVTRPRLATLLDLTEHPILALPEVYKNYSREPPVWVKPLPRSGLFSWQVVIYSGFLSTAQFFNLCFYSNIKRYTFYKTNHKGNGKQTTNNNNFVSSCHSRR